VTVREKEEVVAKALNLGVFRYVEKSGDPKSIFTELANRIQEAHSQRHYQGGLREDEEFFRSVYENQRSGILVIEPSSATIVGANKAALDLIGATKRQVIGSRHHDWIRGIEKDRCEIAGLVQTINGEEKVLTRSSSEKSPILTTVSKAVLAGNEYLIESFVDITKRKADEQELREKRQKYEALFSENPEAVVFCDKSFRVVEVNPRFNMLFGCSTETVKGRDAISVFTPENLKGETNWIKLRLGEGHVQCRTKRSRPDGSEVNVSLFGAPMRLNEGIIGYFLVFEDISEISTVNEELSRMIDEQNVMLGKTSLLNEKLSVTGGLTRHDVRNKLTAINGNAYIAKKRVAGNTDAVSCLSQIEEVTRNIVRILDFAKTYEMLGTQERTRVNVGKMVADAASLFADLKGVVVVNECEELEVMADSLLMELFHNMIDNSLKYGGQKISQIRVHMQYSQDGATELVYEDNGNGIEPEMKGKLFQKGFGKGTGYGLWLIRRICEMYGWTIREEGEYGKGARFVMKIPHIL
jgi:PAS domain S-box-containing protein